MRPQVTVHFAQSLDGRIATRTGHSKWISCDATLRLAHRLRASHDAVVVGVGTVLADDPRLTVRLVSGPSPLRVILDSTLRLPLAAHVLTDGAAATLIATTRSASPDRLAAVQGGRADVRVVEEDPAGRVDLRAMLRELDALGVRSVLIEGGRGVITSALRAGIVDRVSVCIAPKLIGAGIEAVGDLDINWMSQAITFREACFTTVGDDVLFEGQLARAAQEVPAFGAL